MNQWLTETELLREFNISRDVLADMVWHGELKAYKRGDPSTAIDIPRKPKEQEKVETKNLNEFPIYCFRHWENTLLCRKELGEVCPFGGADFYEDGCRWQWDEHSFHVMPGRLTKLVSIVEDVETNIHIQYNALTALLPVLRFRRADVEAWELDQGLAPQDIEPQKQPPQNTNEIYSQGGKDNFFHISGEYWKVGYEGETGTIRDLNGIRYIVTLLERPGNPVSCRELYQAVSGKTLDKIMSDGAAIGEGLNIGGSKQAISDRRTRQICLHKYQELQEALTVAYSIEKKEEIETQMKALMPYLTRRNIPDPNDKKAQVNIGKRLDTAYKAISKAAMKELAKHLQDHIKPDGALGLSYSSSLTWDITR